MFRIAKDPKFRAEIKVNVPTEAGNETQSFTAIFRMMPDERHREAQFSNEDSVVEFLRDAIVSLDGLADDDERPLGYSAELRDRVLALPFARLALWMGYLREMSGARAGN